MAASGTPFQVHIGSDSWPSPRVADLLTLTMTVDASAADWSAEIHSDFPDFDFTVGDVTYDEDSETPTKTFTWSISAGYTALESGLVFTTEMDGYSASFFIEVDLYDSEVQ